MPDCFKLGEIVNVPCTLQWAGAWGTGTLVLHLGRPWALTVLQVDVVGIHRGVVAD